MFFIHYRVSASRANWTRAVKKVSAFQTTPGTVLDVNVTLITKEYRVVSVEKKMRIVCRDFTNIVSVGTIFKGAAGKIFSG